jgi:hypothetical protein
MTPEEIHEEVLELRVEIQKQFLEFSTEMLKAFGDFKADLIKTIWITQLSTIGIILIGMGLLIHFLHGPAALR